MERDEENDYDANEVILLLSLRFLTVIKEKDWMIKFMTQMTQMLVEKLNNKSNAET